MSVLQNPEKFRRNLSRYAIPDSELVSTSNDLLVAFTDEENRGLAKLVELHSVDITPRVVENIKSKQGFKFFCFKHEVYSHRSGSNEKVIQTDDPQYISVMQNYFSDFPTIYIRKHSYDPKEF